MEIQMKHPMVLKKGKEIQTLASDSFTCDEMKHWSHNHLMVLKKAKELQTMASGSCTCNGCLEPVSGPFYSCKEGCCYYLHKVCAELPYEMNHPMHPQHTLTLRRGGKFKCLMCRKSHHSAQFVYNCSVCYFNVDVICASGSHTIKDKCHMHPLIPMQLPSCFLCSICCKEEKGVSYKCGRCPFWVHQDCTVLQEFVECGDHDHQQLTLLPSIPDEVIQKLEVVEILKWNLRCNICYADINTYETVYSCVGCLFFSHVRCTTCGGEDDEDDDVTTKHLPVMKKDWTTLISSIVETPKHAGDLTNNIELPEQISNPDKLIDILDNEIYHFSHDHVLHLHDGQLNDNVCGKMCEACAEPIIGPSYGCTRCDYFLHKCCIRLPKHISHPYHPEHDIKLFAHYPNRIAMFLCSSCDQLCNTFGYKCDECGFRIDVKCASLSGRVKHEGHKHTLSSNIFNGTCSGCTYGKRVRKCERCSFKICLNCSMMPRIVNHRYCKCEGLRLQYFPLKNYNADYYYCDLCERKLSPAYWYYHCDACDQSAHKYCLIRNAGDSNIKFGRRYNLQDQHEHELILTRFTYEYSNCKICVSSLNKGIAVGFECATCPYFKIHLTCVPDMGHFVEWYIR